ncbi:TPA: PIN domain-containing protein [Candidatus Bathyarchaeota archaeon]|nr:PIN domain-containing protein [Candidatus Bathyarchaeota archaeon]
MRKSPEIAEKERNLRTFGLKIIPVTYNRLWREAAKIKGEKPVSPADVFVIATAKTEHPTNKKDKPRRKHSLGYKTKKDLI